MDLKTVFTKTAKGVTQVNQKTQSLSRELMKVLKSIDGKSNIEALAEKVDLQMPNMEKALQQLQKDGFIKVFEVKQEVPMTDFGGDDDDFDFTAPKKIAANAPSQVTFKPSQYRPPAGIDQVERATTPPPSFTPAQPQVDVEMEAKLAAAREKAQAEARARAEREAQIRARLEVEARAKREAEQRAMEEAKRAQAAAEKARAELEAKLAAEKKQRETLSDTKNRLTREQLERESEQQRALTAARAKAEAEAQALAQARAKAEAEAKSLATARMQAEAAAKKQQEELEAAQRELRQQLKAEIEAKIRAEMEEKLNVEVEEQGRAEVEAAVMAEAREEARRLLEEQLRAEREALARAEADAKRRAEDEAKRMLAEQEARIRAEMEAQIAKIAAEKARVEIEARRMAEAQAEAASKAAAELSARLKAEEEARRAAEAETELRKRADIEQRARMEARAKEEAAERARRDAEMNARLAAEKEAKVQAQAQALIEAEMREKSERENRVRFEQERMAREEAEQKAAMEARAREAAAREAAEQVEARERIERAAEEMIAEERRAREKAEERSRAEEEAEARQRAAQVARLKELSEQHERDQAMGIDPDAKKQRYKGKKKGGGALRWAVVGVVMLLIIGVVLIHVLPLGAVNSRFEKALAAWLHDDVSSSGLRVSLFPRPHVKLDQVALGKVLDAKAASGRLYMDLSTLFGDRFVIETLELSEVNIGAEALPRALKWGDGEDRGKSLEIEKVVLRSVKVDVKGVAVEVFDADLRFDKAGKIVRAGARSRDGKWSVDFSPNKSSDAAAGEWTVDFSGRGLSLPIGMPIPTNSINAKGTMAGDSIVFPQVEAKLLEGSATGNLKAEWKNGVSFSSEFSVEKLKVDQLTDVFTRDVALSGRLEGQFTATATAATIGTLLEAPVVQGNFIVREGAVGNADLVQAMRSPGSVGGQTKFAELTGQLRLADGVIHYDKLKLTGGVLLANGNVSVNLANSSLSGGVNAEIRSNVAQDRANFVLSGNVARPSLKRG